jgi:hypothetical protein
MSLFSNCTHYFKFTENRRKLVCSCNFLTFQQMLIVQFPIDLEPLLDRYNLEISSKLNQNPQN